MQLNFKYDTLGEAEKRVRGSQHEGSMANIPLLMYLYKETYLKHTCSFTQTHYMTELDGVKVCCHSTLALLSSVPYR